MLFEQSDAQQLATMLSVVRILQDKIRTPK